MAKKSRNPLAVATKAIDPTLDALFSSSAGPVIAPPKSRYSSNLSEKGKSKSRSKTDPSGEDEDVDDEELSEISEELDDSDDTSDSTSPEDDDENSSDSDEAEDDHNATTEDTIRAAQGILQAATAASDAAEGSALHRGDRKRKRKDDHDDLEDKYLAGLTKDDESEPTGKRPKAENDSSNEDEEVTEDDDDTADVPTHESLAKESKSSDAEKASQTVFLGNVSSEAISSKSAKKTLMNHLSSALDLHESVPPQKLLSLRFRSTAFSAGGMPKRAAYITGSLMDATTKSTNAYAVFSSPAAAMRVTKQLNGTEVLGRHLRVDSIAHPSPTDHRRCIFVGNLGFVDDETVMNKNADGEMVEKKRNKVPSDVEEGLWRTFGKKGKVENVRVVRDPKTRVGKGFAYVQFYDANDVEQALLLDGKKFPPMLPRALRVTRAKDPRKTAQAQERSKAKMEAANSAPKSMKYRPKTTAEEHATAGRATKLYGRSIAARGVVNKSPEQVVFEGRRATAKDGKDLKLGKKGKGKPGRPKGRAAHRAAAWRKKN